MDTGDKIVLAFLMVALFIVVIFPVSVTLTRFYLELLTSELYVDGITPLPSSPGGEGK